MKVMNLNKFFNIKKGRIMNKKILAITLKRESDENDFWELKKMLETSGQYTKKIKKTDVVMIAIRNMLKNKGNYKAIN